MRALLSVMLLSMGLGAGACSKAPCAHATPGSYAGNGFLFVDYPESGPVYQIRFFPACQMDTAHFLNSLGNSLNPGINFGILGPEYKRDLRATVHHIRAQRADGSAEQLNVWPVYLKYSQAQDITLASTGEKALHMDYRLNGRSLKADFFFAGRVELDTLIFLPYRP